MRDDKSERVPETPWRVPVVVEDIPEQGQSFALEADADTRAAIAKMARLRDLPQLAATFDVTRQGSGGVRVVGRVSAVAGQTCVVTLEPLLSPIEEDVDLLFIPQATPAAVGENDGERPASEAKWNDPEPLVDGVVDLGALATEFFILGLDPYPRKPGAVFQPLPERGASESKPFAALAGWSKDRGRR